MSRRTGTSEPTPKVKAKRQSASKSHDNQKSSTGIAKERPDVHKRNFGKLLKLWRVAGSSPLMKAAVMALKERMGPDGKFTVSMLSQMENGVFSNPNGEIFKAMADVYNVSLNQVVLAFAVAKYKIIESENETDLAEVTTLMDLVAKMHATKEAGLAFLHRKILDVRGLAAWEASLASSSVPDKELWVVAPVFVDRINDDVFRAIVALLSVGARITYFVSDLALHRGGEMDLFVNKLKLYQEHEGINLRMGKIHAVGLKPDQLCWMASSFVISNPSSIRPGSANDAQGYIIVTSEDGNVHGVQMSPADISSRVDEIKLFLSKGTLLTRFPEGERS